MNTPLDYINHLIYLALARGTKKVSFAAGKIGTFTLPASKEDFSLTKKTFPDYTINFKSGTAKSWVDDRGHVCLVVDGVTTEGKKIKLSVRSSYE